MATVVSRRVLPPHRHRLITQRPAVRPDGSIFLGLAVAIPLGLLMWLALILAIRALA
jgi:hypothetical protein